MPMARPKNLTSSGTWSSDATSIAGINSAGLASALLAGSANISLSFDGVTGSTPFTVPPPPLVSIAVAPSNQTINAGTTQQFTATGTFADGSVSDITSAVNWSSSPSNIASINTSGLANGLAQGSTTIAAASGSISGSAT